MVVFAIGVLLDGGDLSWKQWMCYVGIGVLVPFGGVVLSYIVLRSSIAHFRHAFGDFAQPERIWYRPWEGEKLMGTWEAVWVATRAAGWGLLCLSFSLLFTYLDHFYPKGGRSLYLPTFWLLTAVSVAGVLAALIQLFATRTYKLRLLFPVVLLATGIVGTLHFRTWMSWRDNTRFDHYDWQAEDADPNKTGEGVYWAGRMIALRPSDWRGYARRMQALRSWGAPAADTIEDIQAAVALGCDDREWRKCFAVVYAQLGRHQEEADELDAAVRYVRRTSDLSFQQHLALEAAFARLHAGQYDLADLRFREKWPRLGALSDLEPAWQEGLLMLHIARGEYQAAAGLPAEVKWFTSRTLTRAWLLATCPDPQIFDPEEALKLTEVEIRANDWNVMRDADRLTEDEVTAAGAVVRFHSYFDTLHMFTYNIMNRARAFVRAAAYTNLGRFEEADAAFAEASTERRLGVSGFWKPRRDALAECIKNRQPYRDHPAK
jgi:tetratricopeptide (TPR) repeat protein